MKKIFFDVDLSEAREKLDKRSHTLHEIVKIEVFYKLLNVRGVRRLYPKGVDIQRLPKWIKA